MCHYAQLTFPEPAVIVVTLFEPTVEVEPVKPAPIVIVKVVGYLRITRPVPPFLATPFPPPAPLPVLAPPATLPFPFPPAALVTAEPVIELESPAPPAPEALVTVAPTA